MGGGNQEKNIYFVHLWKGKTRLLVMVQDEGELQVPLVVCASRREKKHVFFFSTVGSDTGQVASSWKGLVRIYARFSLCDQSELWMLWGEWRVLRNQPKMRPHPLPSSLGTASLKHFQNGSLKSNSKNLMSLKGKRYIICLCFLEHSICRWSYTSSYWNLGSQEESPGSWKPEKHPCQDSDLKLLQELGYQLGKGSLHDSGY